MTSQPGQQPITIHILLNISESIGNQKMKLVQLVECNKKKIFFQNHAEKETALYEKALYELNANDLHLVIW